ncbi:PREDICTED: putative HERV-K_Xq28 provirus ancestral Pol protein, partial [Merops nubicus]|uniref:putative HERV-K_Xq28 provirus ancestral Pol protein n=1 Tax=Merops nubicus TaxID=57421 RepID=UPI0004F0A63C
IANYAVIDLANAFFTIPIAEEHLDQCAFTRQGRQYTFTRLPQGWVHSPTICHPIVAEHLDEVKLPPHMQIAHDIDDILIQGSIEEELQQILELVVDHVKQKGWEINPTKIQGPSQVVNFLGIHRHCGHEEILLKAQQKILDLVVPQNKKEAQRFIRLFGFWRQHIPHLGQILAPLYKVTRKKYEFEWGNDQQSAFELAKEAIQRA